MGFDQRKQMLNLQSGDHLCLFYEKDAAEQIPALVPFIQDGLSRDERFIYIADDQTVDELAGRLEQSGIDVAGETDRGALKLWTRREWRQPGELRSDRKSRQVLRLIKEAAESGFKGARFAVEMTWVLGPDIDAARLEHWEATLNTIFVPGSAGRIVCQYNRSRLAPEMMLAALRTHPQVILGDHVQSNSFYEAPLILKGGADGKSGAAKVEWMIAQLERARAAEKHREEMIQNQISLAEAERSRNVTERKQAEIALRQAREELSRTNEELERRVQQRTVELEQTRLALLADIEEQKKLEEQLRQAQKMESIGTLAGGIAHDFNNILNIIKGYATLLFQRFSTDEEVATNLKVIDEAIDRGASVVRQLLTLARKTAPRLSRDSANDVISALAKLLKQTFPKTVEISVELAPELPPVLVDSSQISQALLNLCVNARDAMADRGTLTLRTRLAEAREVRESHAEAEPVPYASLEVSDTGAGMEESIRSRIFEPFFTTKETADGTGLGLAIVYGIMKNHRGFIDAESKVGEGTTFRLYLPAAMPEKKPGPEQESAQKSSLSAQRSGGRTVLVAEDEEAMGRLLKTVLAQHGYQVLVARDGHEALDLYRRYETKIDVVLVDMALPKIAGRDVILKMKEKNPNVSVIVASGYVGPELKAEMYRAGVKGFVDKPYRPGNIVELLDTLAKGP